MEHVIDRSTEAYANTPYWSSFMIFHDGLSAWWEPDAQKYTEDRGFKNRQFRNTAANKGTPAAPGQLPPPARA